MSLDPNMTNDLFDRSFICSGCHSNAQSSIHFGALRIIQKIVDLYGLLFKWNPIILND